MTPDIQARLRVSALELRNHRLDGGGISEPQYYEREFLEAADEIDRLTSDLADLKHDMERLMESTTAEATENVRLTKEVELRHTCPRTHEAADAFWKAWKENGETDKHGYYESTWMAIDAALTIYQGGDDG